MEIWKADRAGRLDSEERRKTLPPEETLKKLGLAGGQSFADIGCGVGYFTIPGAKIAGEGASVYALDVSTELLAILTEKMEAEKLQNIHILQTEEYDFKLPAGTAGFALICNVLHEQSDRKRFLTEAGRILEPGGTLAVIEWIAVQGERGPALEERIPAPEMNGLLATCGFTQVKEVEINSELYGVIAIKK